MGTDLTRTKIKLTAPTFLTDGNLAAIVFPLKNFLTLPTNPIGTYYRYTLDSTDPSDTSSIWDHHAITLSNISKTFKIRAFNPDHIPSDTATLTFQLNWNMVFTREGKGTSEKVSRDELDKGTNKIALSGGVNETEVEITYRFTPDDTPKPYTGPFHIPLEKWTAKGAKVYATITPKSALYPEIIEEEFTFKIEKHKLPAPRIIVPPTRIVKAGDVIRIEFSHPNGETRTSVNGGVEQGGGSVTIR